MAYKMTDEIMELRDGTTLHRIEATEDFGNIHAGDMGGWIENESNLTGNAWVGGEAMAYGHAVVGGRAVVDGNAVVRNNAHVLRDAHVGDNVSVEGNARITGSAEVGGNAVIGGDALIGDNARVDGDAQVFGRADVLDNAHITGNAGVTDNAAVVDRATVDGMAAVMGDTVISDDAHIGGNAVVMDGTVGGNTEILRTERNVVVRDESMDIGGHEVRIFTYQPIEGINVFLTRATAEGPDGTNVQLSPYFNSESLQEVDAAHDGIRDSIREMAADVHPDGTNGIDTAIERSERYNGLFTPFSEDTEFGRLNVFIDQTLDEAGASNDIIVALTPANEDMHESYLKLDSAPGSRDELNEAINEAVSFASDLADNPEALETEIRNADILNTSFDTDDYIDSLRMDHAAAEAGSDLPGTMPAYAEDSRTVFREETVTAGGYDVTITTDRISPDSDVFATRVTAQAPDGTEVRLMSGRGSDGESEARMTHDEARDYVNDLSFAGPGAVDTAIESAFGNSERILPEYSADTPLGRIEVYVDAEAFPDGVHNTVVTELVASGSGPGAERIILSEEPVADRGGLADTVSSAVDHAEGLVSDPDMLEDAVREWAGQFDPEGPDITAYMSDEDRAGWNFGDPVPEYAADEFIDSLREAHEPAGGGTEGFEMNNDIEFQSALEYSFPDGTDFDNESLGQDITSGGPDTESDVPAENLSHVPAETVESILNEAMGSFLEELKEIIGTSTEETVEHKDSDETDRVDRDGTENIDISDKDDINNNIVDSTGLDRNIENDDSWKVD